MIHRNARLAVAGRLILVSRVLAGRPVSHVAKEMGVSRQCAHRWVSRYRALGMDGLADRSSRPLRSPRATPVQQRELVLDLRRTERFGPNELAARTGVSASTASRLIARAGLPRLHELDPISGVQVRASRRTQVRYEHAEPGDLVHVDVKKLGRIPDGGGWRIEGPNELDHRSHRSQRIGFDYVHAAVDDHSRLAYAEVLGDEKGATCAGFLARAAQFYASHGIAIRRVMSDNAMNYTKSNDFRDVLATLGAKHILIRPHCPWQNGKVERFNRTMQEGWAYRQAFNSNDARTQALSPWLDHYNYDRPHTACGGQPPISRVSRT